VSKLILISPAGMLKVDENENIKIENSFLQGSNIIRRLIYKFVKAKFSNGSGITSIY